MRSPARMETIQIELTSACVLKCSNCTRFCGTHKVPFFLDEDVLFKLYPRTKNAESAMLESFDLARDRIFEVAGKAYRPGQRRAFYVLTANDF